jgi:4-amino-4-deoxy-L-arabinose transferase-like glycosyltransferase
LLVLLAPAIVLPLLLFAYPLALDIPALDPAEGLHASIAQEMIERGDWVTPRFLGKPFFDKPILYFTAEAVSMRLFGMHEAALRLPGLLFGLLGAVTAGLLGWRMFGRNTGVLATLFYATMILPTTLAQAAAHDVALIPFVNLAILGFWESDRATSRRRAWGCTLATGVALGLACLSKGLVGIAVVGVAYGYYLLAARRLTLAACLRGAAALAIAMLIASPWYLAVEARHPGFLYYFFVARHVLGYTTDTQPHANRPFWYYLPILLAGGMPWILYLPTTLHDAWLRRRSADPRCRSGLLLLVCWAAGGTLFLSVAHSKSVTYIWPVFPSLAILAAVSWRRFWDGSLDQSAYQALGRTLRNLSWTLPLLPPLIVIAVHFACGLDISWQAWTAVLAAAALATLPLWFWKAGHAGRALSTAIVAVAVQFAVLMTVVVPGVSISYSARDLARHFNAAGRLPPRVLLTEERVGSIVFYLDRKLRAELRPGQLEDFQLARLEELPTAEPGTVVAVPERWVEPMARCIDLRGIAFQQAGHYRVYEAQRLAPAVLKPAARGYASARRVAR